MTNFTFYFSHGWPLIRTKFTSIPACNGLIFPKTLSISSLTPITQRYKQPALYKNNQRSTLCLRDGTNNVETTMPTMSEILESSREQNLDLQLQTLGPLFRITAKSLETGRVVGKAEGVIRVWLDGRLLHLDTIRLSPETLQMKRSIFGIGLFIGAVAVRHGYDCGCRKAELLAINDTDLYHSKLVKFYSRAGFKPVYEVTGSSMGDLPHMLVWGGVGTRMDANVEELLMKWCARFKSKG